MAQITEKIITCIKCENIVTNREHLTCSVCDKTFHLICTKNVSTKYFYLMTSEGKQRWKCQQCQQHQPCYSHDNDTAEMNYVTTRAKIDRSRLRNRSFNDLDDSKLSLSDCSTLASSLPDLRSQDCEACEENQSIIESLKSQLESAHSQIDELMLENGVLQKKIIAQDLKIKQLAEIVTPGSKTSVTTISSEKRSRKLRKQKLVPKKNLDFTDNDDPDKSFQDLDIVQMNMNHQLQTEKHDNNRSIIDSETQTESVPNDAVIYNIGNDNLKKIWIFGSQRCVGLAATILDTRKNTSYENYSVSSTTKPNASTEDILKDMENNPIGHKDKIIIGIGENDCNPVKIVSELYAVLKKYESNGVIVLNVRKNIHLDENMLNSQLKILCNNFPNCKFVETFEPIEIVRYYHKLTARIINSAIDFMDYKDKYLQVLYRKNTKNSYQKLEPEIHSSINANCDYLNQQLKPRKGTIPFYFPVVKKQNNILSMSPCNTEHNNKVFFRT